MIAQFLKIIVIFFIFKSTNQTQPIAFDLLNFQQLQNQLQKDLILNQEQNKNQLTIWGWIRFNNDSNTQPETYILQLSNIQFEQAIPDESEFKGCPWTFVQFQEDTNIRYKQEFKDNQSCIKFQNYISIIPFINLEFKDNNFKLQLKNKNEKVSLIENFSFEKNEWIKIQISIDFANTIINYSYKNYSNGEIKINKNYTQLLQKKIYTEKNIEFILSPKYLNQDQTQSNSMQIYTYRFFIANLFFEDIQYLYMIESSKYQYNKNDIYIDHLFSKYCLENDQENNIVQIKGDKQILSQQYSNLYGIQFNNQSYVEINTSKQDNVYDQLTFMITFKCIELPKNQIFLFQKGKINEDGYASVVLKKINDEMNIIYTIEGQKNQIIYHSKQSLKINQVYTILFGIKTQPDNNTILILKEINGSIKIIDSQYQNYFKIHSSYYSIVNQQNNQQDLSKIIIYRYTMLNTLQPFFMTVQNKLSKQCIQNLNVFDQSLCLNCKDSLLQPQYQCDTQCSSGYFNIGQNICTECKNESCINISQNQYKIIQQNTSNFILKFQNDLQNDNYKIENLIQVKILTKHNKEFTEYEYFIYKQKDNTYIINIVYQNELNHAEIQINIINNQNSVYFSNGDLLYERQQTFHIHYVCFVSDTVNFTVQFLAFFIMALFYLCFILLIIFTCMNKKSNKNYSTLWKYCLMIWIKLQNVSLSYLAGTNGPCTSGIFFETLFKINAKWMTTNYIFNSIYENVPIYKNLLDQNQPENQTFFQQNIERYFLNNAGMVFYLHIIVLIIFIILKFLNHEKNSNKKISKLVQYFQYSLLIIFYLLFSVQINIFSFVNLRQISESNFIISTIISFAYIIFFIVYVFYFLILILNNKQYWNNKKLNKKLFFFTCGYRNVQFVKTFDLVVFSISFTQWFFIGFLYKEPLAQTILLLFTSLIIIACALIYGPWVYDSINLLEVVSMSFGCIPLLFAIAIASWSKQNNPFKGDREGFFAYTILVSIVISLMISIVLFLKLLFQVTFQNEKMKDIKYPNNPFIQSKNIMNQNNEQNSISVDFSEDEEYSKQNSDKNEKAKKQIIHLKSLKQKSKEKNQKKEKIEQKDESKSIDDNKEMIHVEEQILNQKDKNSENNTYSDSEL